MNELPEYPLIEAITKIGNHERVVKDCEPNIVEPAELKKWMVVRTLKAFLLFQDEWEKQNDR